MNAYLEQIIQIKKELDTAISHLRDELRDANVSLDERWKLFEQSYQYLPIRSHDVSYEENLDLPNSIIGEQFDRYEKVSYIEMFDSFSEYVINPDKILIWKECVLKSGYGSFINDW